MINANINNNANMINDKLKSLSPVCDHNMAALNQNMIGVIIDNKKFRLDNIMYIMITKLFKPINIGVIVLDSTAISGVWVYAMKNKVTTTVDGNPIIMLPSFAPYFSVMIVMIVIHNAPVIKLSNTFKPNSSIIN